METLIKHDPDFRVLNAGSIYVVTPLNEDARAWVEENVSDDRVSFGRGFAVEPRYVENLLEGIAAAGFEV